MPRATQQTGLSSPEVTARLHALIGADGRPLVAIAASAGLSKQRLNQVIHEGADLRVSTVARLLAALGRRWRDLD